MNTKIYLIIAVVAVAVAVAFGTYKSMKPSTTGGINPTTDYPVSTATANNPSYPTVGSGNNSNASLDADLKTANTNLDSLDSQNTTVDQNLNLQAVDPSQ